MPPKKGFGEKLKGFGRAVGREAKKIPGRIYREGIKPEAKRILERFTEVGPASTSPISGEPQAGHERVPFEEGPKGFRGGTAQERARARKGLLPAKILSPAEQVSKPAQTIAEQLRKPKPAYYPLAGGRTFSYKVGRGEYSATEVLKRRDAAREARRAKTRPKLRRGTQKEKAARDAAQAKAISQATMVTTAKPLTDQTRATPKAEPRTKKQPRGSLTGYRTPKVTATAEKPKTEPATPTPKKETRTDRTLAARKQRAGLKESRKGKAGKRKFSGRKTAKVIGEAARASQEPLEIDRLDTTAQEMARFMTEQDVGREAERAEAALKQGRRPRREKARYRYQTRGYKRSEGRGR